MMEGPGLVVLIPALAALLSLIVPGHRLGAAVNIAASLATLAAAAALLTGSRSAGAYFIVDDLNACFVAINAFVGFTTAVFSATYIPHEAGTGRLTPALVRFYHAMFQAMTAAMNLALIANNIGLLWVGLELATLITVVMVGLYRTPAALEAAWKYFILGSVGISLAFLGTILIYLAGQPVLGEGLVAMTWSRIYAVAPQLDEALVNLAFMFLLIGYGTKTALVPLHAWLPDAHAEGPTPVTAVLSGLLLNVAILALLRFKMIVEAHPTALRPGPILVVMGLASLLFAVVMLYQRGDLKRLFAYSSIEHIGLAVMAFGLGGPVANFAGLFHIAMHSLTKSAIFFAVGRVAQIKGTQRIAGIRGLGVSHPALAFGLGAGILAIAGLPPFGLFMSEFLILTAAFARSPWLMLLAALGLVLGFAALLMRLQDLLLGEPDDTTYTPAGSMLPLYLHLALVMIASLYIPAKALAWLQRAGEFLG
jgi:hydrogenase-4 component F